MVVLKFLVHVAIALLVNLSCGYAKNNQKSYKPCLNTYIVHSEGVGGWKGNISVVNCSIQTQVCDISVSDYYPGPAKDLFKTNVVEWFLSDNLADKFDRIVLNITWTPSHNSYIKYQSGFQVSVTNVNMNKTSTFYYCIENKLSYEQHVQSVFFYDCYGLSRATYIKPEDEFKVRISSLPGPTKHPPGMERADDLNYAFKVPDCSSKALYNVRECVLRRELQVDVINIFCANRSVEFYYNVPAEYGRFSKLLLCQGEANRFNECLTRVKLWREVKMKAIDRYQIPDGFFVQHHNYTLYVWGSFQYQTVAKTSFNFTNCGKYQDLSVHIKVISIVLGILLATLCVLIFRSRRKRCRANIKKISGSLNFDSVRNEISSTSSDSDPKVSVYVVFCDDHPKHKEVVNNFAAHLMTDYGFEVIFELWEPNELAQNCTQWMHNSMNRADKIIVIWSPGATKRWENYKVASKSNAVPGRIVPSDDTFTPVVSQILSDLFRRRNMGKYYFAFFDYGDQNCAPVAELQDHVCQTFVLMKDFDRLYFHLKNLEIHGPGVEIRAQPAGQAYRLQLEKVILHMQNLVSNCEDWYNIRNDVAIPNPAPESGIYLAEDDADLSYSPSFPIPDIEPLIERPAPIIEPVVPVDSSENPYFQLQVLNSLQERY